MSNSDSTSEMGTRGFALMDKIKTIINWRKSKPVAVEILPKPSVSPQPNEPSIVAKVENPIPTDVAAEAVADAMMFAQSQLLIKLLKEPDKHAYDIKHIEQTLQVVSLGACEWACASSINFLMEKYPDEFDKIVMLKSYFDPQHPFAANLDLTSPNHFHAYFLAYDRKGIWYAGSPANHIADNPRSPLVRMIRSPDLSEVLGTIKQEDGGIWPTPAFIQSSLEANYQPPVLGIDKFRVFNRGGILAMNFVRKQGVETVTPDQATATLRDQ